MDIHMESYVSKQKYWFALNTALYYGGRFACLSIFHNQETLNGFPYHHKRLFQALLQQQPLLESLYRQGALSFDEWKTLFPDKQETDSRKFELGMLMALLHHLVLPPPVNGWVKHPNPHDTGTSFSLLKLREMKDKLTGWQDTCEITHDVFQKEWSSLCEILFGLGFNVAHLNPIYDATRGETLRFRKEHKKEFHQSLKEAKILFFRKTLHEVKKSYTKHLDNVVTITSVVGFEKMEYLQNQALELKEPLKDLECQYDHLSHNRFKSPLQFLHKSEVVTEEIGKSDEQLDNEIEKHNRRLDKDDVKVKKKSNSDDGRDRQPLKASLSMRRASIVGWLRRNTLRSVSRSPRPTVLPTGNGDDDVFTDGIDVGDY